jgi:hypothetical protein
MTTATYQEIADTVGANLSRNEDSTSRDRARRAVGVLGTVKIRKDAADTFANSTLTRWDMPIDDKRTFTAVKLIGDGSLSSDNTNYATVTLSYNDGNGGNSTTIATQTTKTSLGGGSGDWTAGTALALTVSNGSVVVDGTSTRQYLKIVVAKTGSGVAVPALTMYADYILGP